jgi:hypothetical protein
MRTMKHIAVVLTFAAVLAAQQGKVQQAKDPKLELAAIIAVEEQERDLGKAEKLYRAAIDDAKLSEAARTQANLRLGTLLQRLDRAAEAKPFLDAAAKAGEIGFDDFGARPPAQDVEREKALREKARELVQRVLHQVYFNPEDLLWIGAPAIPEIIAALQAEAEKKEPGTTQGISALAGFLWRMGGDAAEQFLAGCTKHPRLEFRRAIAVAAWQATTQKLLSIAASFLRDGDPSDQVPVALLKSGISSEKWLSQRFEPALIVDAAIAGPPAGRKRMLEWASQPGLFDSDPGSLAKVHAVVREWLTSTDPEVGSAAQRFLLTSTSQTSVEGVELLLRELPKMQSVTSVSWPPSKPFQSGSAPPRRFTAAEAGRLLPLVDACARTLGPVPENVPQPSKKQWLVALMNEVAAVLEGDVVPTVLAWVELGYDVLGVLQGKITAANAKDVIARWDASQRDQLYILNMLVDADLPQAAFPLLRDKAEQARASGNWKDGVKGFCYSMAKTGHPEAADWILAEAARDENATDWIAWPLVMLGRRTQAENVRVALRKAALGGAQDSEHCLQALLALLSMGDVQALDIVVQKSQLPRSVQHPYASNAEPEFLRRAPARSDSSGGPPRVSAPLLTPLQYLLYKDPDPPHGFTDEQIIDVLHKIAKNQMPQDWQPRFWSHTAIPDRLLGAFARIAAGVPARNGDERNAQFSWISLVLERVKNSTSGQSPLHGWVAEMLQHEQPRVRALVLENLDEQLVTRERALVEKCLDVDDEECALQAALKLTFIVSPSEPAQKLTFIASPIEVERLLQNKHPRVRDFAIRGIPARLGAAGDKLVLPLTKDPDDEVRKSAASCLGAMVSKDAVPALIELLRDANEQVRSRAADALTRIRFYHEQQAHWDRILKGLDASAASAAEKLLLQAKPGAPKEQRLLAITSLGALGVPEALPFLIEWTNDADADVAAKAKAAITQIHLNPRK